MNERKYRAGAGVSFGPQNHVSAGNKGSRLRPLQIVAKPLIVGLALEQLLDALRNCFSFTRRTQQAQGSPQCEHACGGGIEPPFRSLCEAFRQQLARSCLV